MSVAAPPRGHDVLAGVEHDPIEALIEEARERARRRRLYRGAASVVAIGGCATRSDAAGLWQHVRRFVSAEDDSRGSGGMRGSRDRSIVNGSD